MDKWQKIDDYIQTNLNNNNFKSVGDHWSFTEMD